MAKTDASVSAISWIWLLRIKMVGYVNKKSVANCTHVTLDVLNKKTREYKYTLFAGEFSSQEKRKFSCWCFSRLWFCAFAWFLIPMECKSWGGTQTNAKNLICETARALTLDCLNAKVVLLMPCKWFICFANIHPKNPPKMMTKEEEEKIVLSGDLDAKRLLRDWWGEDTLWWVGYYEQQNCKKNQRTCWKKRQHKTKNFVSTRLFEPWRKEYPDRASFIRHIIPKIVTKREQWMIQKEAHRVN